MNVATGGWNIAEHRGPDGLRAVEADWRRLFGEMTHPATWHSYEAYSAYFDHLCPSPDHCRFLALSDGERVRAILPLEERMDRSLGVALRVWGLTWSEVWRPTDVIGPEDEARAALLPAAIEYLRRQPDRPALLVIGQTAKDSMLWSGFGSKAVAPVFIFDDGAEYLFPTDVTAEEFLGRLSSRTRKRIKSLTRKCEELPGARYVTALDPDALAEEFERFLEVEASGWKAENGSAITQHPERVAYYRALMERLDRDGRCRISSLYADGRCVASEYVVRLNRRVDGLKNGYLEEYAKVAPGIVLTHRSLMAAVNNGEIDLVSGVGDAEWLVRWHPERNDLVRAYVGLRPSARLLLPLLRLRYGPARRLVRRASGRAADSHAVGA